MKFQVIAVWILALCFGGADVLWRSFGKPIEDVCMLRKAQMSQSQEIVG